MHASIMPDSTYNAKNYAGVIASGLTKNGAISLFIMNV